MRRLDTLIAPQRGHLFPWVPVCFGLGIGLYFALPVEPERAFLIGLSLCLGACLLACRRLPESGVPLALACALICAGIVLSAWRTERVAEPVLSFRYYGPIEGRVIEVDRNLSDRLRLTLDQVVLEDMAPHRTPAKVRVSLSGRQGATALEPGARVILTGHLSPPSGPAEPGGFDFRRHAWFESLGAVGYTRNPVLALEAPRRDTPGVWLAAQRMRLGAEIRARMPGQPGAFAAAVLTGDRSGLSRDTLDQMRASNLAHLLAISGLHMGLLTSFVFLVVRYCVALIPWLAVRYDGRKIAAVVALAAAGGYLALSGGSIATQRAFVMAAVMLTAVMLDRQMLTLRAVATAAILILLWRPEALLSVGFQMSFAATTCLVWVFSLLRTREWWRRARRWRPVLALALSSAVAGLATAPIGAAQFNQIAQFGLIANLMAVPVMGMMVMPAAVIAMCLAPFGLADAGLWVMGLGCRWILAVAEKISGVEASLIPVAMPAAPVIPILCLGALWLMLWQGRWRWSGGIPMALALFLWSQTSRPPILIAESGALIGVLQDGQRVLNKPKGDGFVARSWLENDGDQRDQPEAAEVSQTGFVQQVQGVSLRHLSKKQLKQTPAPCEGVDLLILPVEAEVPCFVITPDTLRQTGALAIWPSQDGLILKSAKVSSGTRPWTSKAHRQSKQAQPETTLIARIGLTF